MRHSLALCVLLPVLAQPALAQPALAQRPPAEPPRVSPYAGGSLTLGDENDFFGGTDRYYSNGLMLRWDSPATTPEGPVAWLDRGFSWLLGPGEFRWGLALEQTIFTPEEIRRRVPDPRDRPYAGHLVGSLNLERSTERVRTALSFQLGVTGAASGGEFVQNRWHDVINKYHAEGWDNQLGDEVTFGVLAERQWRIPGRRIAGLDTELMPTTSLALGTAYTYAGGGALLRIGDALGADWGPARIRPAISNSPLSRPQHDLGWYAFAGLGGRVVARNLFLDGNTFRDSPSVDRRPVVAEAQIGAAVLWRGMRLAYTHVWQSKEFNEQRGGQAFGSISLTVPF
jgi:hypothetical protein